MATVLQAIERVHPPRRLINFFNPLMAFLIKRSRALGKSLLILHYEGRKSGRRYNVPTGYRETGDHLSLLTDSTWRYNFSGGRRVEVTHRGTRRPATATLVDDPGQVAPVLEETVRELGVRQAARRLGVRMTLDRPPTRGEWVEFLRRTGLSIVRVDLD